MECCIQIGERKEMGRTLSKRIRVFYGAVLCIMMLIAFHSMPVQAASLDLAEICAQFETAIQNDETQIAFTASANYTLEQMLQQLAKAAENQQMLFTGEYTYRKQQLGDEVNYTFLLTQNSLVKVTFLKNEAAAYKAALGALKDSDYTTTFHSDTSYYPIFLLMLQQHPEYNYDTMVWKNSNGTYGYRRSRELTESEQDAKMRAADKKASAVVKNKLKKGMTAAQKLKAIHDYLIRLCSYDYGLTDTNGYENSLTAYGALVKKKAVCQGYTAAFNLIAQKAGIYSIAVCGTVSSGKHTWNYVKAGSSYRYIDCTWDETLQTGKSIRYDYFNVKKAVIAKNHAWDAKKFTSKYFKYCKYLM